MFCSKCGTQIPDGAKFCPSCGNPVELPVQAAPAEPVAPVEPVAPAEPVAPVEPEIPAAEPVAPAEPVQSVPYTAPAQSVPYAAPAQNVNAPAYSQPANAIPVYAPVQNGKKAKGGKKKKTGLVVVCVILAVIIAAGVAAACAWQNIARSFLGEAGFYAWREAKTLDKILSVDGFDSLDDNKVINARSKVNVKAEDGVYDKAFDAVSADVDMSFDSEEDKAVAVIGLVAEDETKVTANLSFDDGKLGVTVPELTDEKFYMDLDFLDVDNVDLDYETIGKELLNIYKQIDNEHLKTKTVVTKTNINGVKCRYVTLSIDGDEAAEMLADLLTAIKNDDTLINSLDPAFKAAYDTTVKMNAVQNKAVDEEKTYEDYKEEFLKGLDSAIKEIKESVGEEDIVLTLSYASDSKGYITSRNIKYTVDGEDAFKADITSSVKGGAKILNAEITSEENSTVFTVARTDGKKNASFHIFGKSVEVYKGEEDDGSSFEIFLNNIRVEKVGTVNVVLGNISATVTPIYNGEENEDSTVKFKIDLENNGTYDINAGYEVGEISYNLNIVSTLSSGSDFSKFIKPDKDGLTDFDEFIESMSDKYEEVAEDILGDVDPDLLLQISKKAQIKDCEAREKLIEENLVKYMKKGNGGKAFKNVNDVLAKQKAFDKMFDEGHPPYCTCGGSSGTKYEIYVYSDLTYSIRCRNPKCPNYGEGPATKK